MFKKIIPYILIFVLLIGFLSPSSANAQVNGDKCTPSSSGAVANSGTFINGVCVPQTPPDTSAKCYKATRTGNIEVSCNDRSATTGPVTFTQEKDDDALLNSIPSCTSFLSIDLGACIVRVFYYIFYALPAFILTVAAKFFNALAALSLSSKIYTSASFIDGAWGVVRDISNIFFILVLLYVAMEIILDLGGHGAKKTIVAVIIMALMINFSMFFTKIVIDSSNILALIFYNKMTVVSVGNSQPPPYSATFNGSSTGVPEKDV
ncbi:hypothetical protein K2P96_02275, partial [Patescibacteria group bacterium]|nr:hypothetical protein [Patescibacteria group bacterium]